MNIRVQVPEKKRRTAEFRRPPLDVGLGLEREASRKLPAAGSNRGAIGRQRAVDPPKVALRDVPLRRLEAGMIQHVHKVCPELKTIALFKVEFFGQRKIHNAKAWPTQAISTLRPEGEIGLRRTCEGSWVEVADTLNTRGDGGDICVGVADPVEIE